MLFQDMTVMISELEPRYTKMKARNMPGTFISHLNFHNHIRKELPTIHM